MVDGQWLRSGPDLARSVLEQRCYAVFLISGQRRHLPVRRHQIVQPRNLIDGPLATQNQMSDQGTKRGLLQLPQLLKHRRGTRGLEVFLAEEQVFFIVVLSPQGRTAMYRTAERRVNHQVAESAHLGEMRLICPAWMLIVGMPLFAGPPTSR